jgi:hypothetical protein
MDTASVIDQKRDYKQKLQKETDEVGNNNGNRNSKPRKINLAKYLRTANKRTGSFGKARGKVVP